MSIDTPTDVLPLVEFKLEPGIPHDEAMELLASEDKTGKSGRRRSDLESQSSGPRWQEQTEGNIQSLKIEASPTPDYYSNYDEDDGDDQMNYMGGGGGDSGYQDPFTARFVPGTQGGDGEEDGNLGLTGAVIVNRQVLRRLNLNDVVVVEWPPPLERQYYRNLMPDVQITKCNCCNEVIFLPNRTFNGFYVPALTLSLLFHSFSIVMNLKCNYFKMVNVPIAAINHKTVNDIKLRKACFKDHSCVSYHHVI